MLISLLRRYLGAYTPALLTVVVLQFLGTIATLYLPTLNADIIDNGVVKQDNHYIWTTGGVMLATTRSGRGAASMTIASSASAVGLLL